MSTLREVIVSSKENRPVAIGSLSDIGRLRKANQDRVWVREGAIGALDLDAILVVADGMGGHAGGEKAAETAIEAFRNTLEHIGPVEVQKGGVLRVLEDAAHVANKAVESAGIALGLEGMGTTFTSLTLEGGKVHLVHAGDSRAYAIRRGKVHQLSTDHSWVQEQVAAGLLRADEAREHPARNMITRALGIAGPLEFQAASFSIKGVQALVLCSDGLHNNVTDKEIADIALKGTPQRSCEKLVELANERGGQDNISVVVARPGLESEEDPKAAIQDVDTLELAGRRGSPLWARFLRTLLRR